MDKFFRDEDHLAEVRKESCENCFSNAGDNHAHHCGTGGTGIKTHDYFCMSLCPACHRKCHHEGIAFYRQLPPKTMLRAFQHYSKAEYYD
jgi:hypothetical protein